MSAEITDSQAPCTLVLLLDHDNIPPNRFKITDIIKCWLEALSAKESFPKINELKIRAYGGWFEDMSSSPKRYEAVDFYQNTCPAIVRINDLYFRVSFSFADDLLASTDSLKTVGDAKVTHTVANRSSKKGFAASKRQLNCRDVACEVANIKKWIRTDKACFKPTCPSIFAKTFHRKEQKQVDVHIATDLLVLAIRKPVLSQTRTFVAVASDDTDFIPAMASAARITDGTVLSIIRFQTRSSYLDQLMIEAGVVIVNV